MYVRQATAVAQLGMLALRTHDSSALINEATQVIADALRTDASVVFENLHREDAYIARGAVGLGPGFVGHRVNVRAGSPGGVALATRQPLACTDYRADERFRTADIYTVFGLISGISVPMIGDRHPWGLIGAHMRRPRVFTKEEINFVQAVANILSAVFDRRHSEQTIRDLSTPVLPIQERVLLMPVVGGFDEQRVLQLRDRMLRAIREYRALAVVVDVTGADLLTRNVADHFMQTAQAARLLGAKVIVTGITAAMSEAIVLTGLDFAGFATVSDLRSGIALANEWQQQADDARR
jgi:anti-anti-sigma regulatory factor